MSAHADTRPRCGISQTGGFAALTEPVNDPRLVKIVRRHLELHAVATSQANEAFPHFARDVGENGVVVGELHAEHCARKNGSDLPLDFDSFFGIHILCKTGARVKERRLAESKALLSSANQRIDAAALRERALRLPLECVLALPCH